MVMFLIIISLPVAFKSGASYLLGYAFSNSQRAAGIYSRNTIQLFALNPKINRYENVRLFSKILQIDILLALYQEVSLLI